MRARGSVFLALGGVATGPRAGSLKALAKPRGPKGRRRDPVVQENEQLRKENARLRRRRRQHLRTQTLSRVPSHRCGFELTRRTQATAGPPGGTETGDQGAEKRASGCPAPNASAAPAA